MSGETVPVPRLSSIILALVLPFLILYFLMLFGFAARSLLPRESEGRRRPLFSLRDIAIATLTLDSVAVWNSLFPPPHGAFGGGIVRSVLLAMLFCIHVVFLVFATRWEGQRDLHEGGEGILSRALLSYFGFVLLVSNGVTVVRLIDLLSGGL